MALTLKDTLRISDKWTNQDDLGDGTKYFLYGDVKEFCEYFYDELKYLDEIDEEQYLEIVKLHKKVFNL